MNDKRMDRIPTFEMYKRAVADEITDDQIDLVRKAIGNAVKQPVPRLNFSVIDFNEKQLKVLSAVLSKKGYFVSMIRSGDSIQEIIVDLDR